MMKKQDRPVKAVLVVDDEPAMGESLRDRFIDCNYLEDFPYRFEVDLAASARECARLVRLKKDYAVIVLDVRLENERSGLDAAFALNEQLGADVSIRISFTGYPRYEHCVESIRHGCWDYIVKEDIADKSVFQVVVESATDRLRQLDLAKELESRIAGSWLPHNLWKLLPEYAGRVVAMWHEPEINVIAEGQDAFELEANLSNWRRTHKQWEQPFIVQIPERREIFDVGSETS